MRTSALATSAISAWIMTFIYDRIEKTIGMELDVLLFAAVATLVIGLYLGLYANNKETTKEETRV
jgi:hypothetical protein